MRELSARLGPPRFSDSSALSLRFPRESGGPGAAVVPLPREWSSAQWIFRRHDAWARVKSSTLRCAEGMGVRGPFGAAERGVGGVGTAEGWREIAGGLGPRGPDA